MKANRRTVLKAGAAAAALTGTQAWAASTPALTVYDSRHAASRRFARSASAAIDVAVQDEALWRDLRIALPRQRIEGLTTWSDWVMVRGYLEEQGLRVRTERLDGKLFRWSMG